MRLKALVEQLRYFRDPCLITCTAGYNRFHSDRPTEKRRRSLAHQLERYVREHLSPLPEFITLMAEPQVWGTREEILAGIEMATELGFVKKGECIRLLIASHRLHLRRIRIYANYYAPPQWKPRYLTVAQPFPWQAQVLEWVKMARDFPLHFLSKR